VTLEFPIELEFRNVDFWKEENQNPEKKPLEQGGEPTTNSTHI